MNELVVADRASEWRRLKALVLDSVSSPITRRVYNLGLDEFIAWFTERPRSAGFTKATVTAWRVALEARKLGPISINVRITAVRKLAVEAAENGLLAPELAAGIARIKGVPSHGTRVGKWLSLRQAQALLWHPLHSEPPRCSSWRIPADLRSPFTWRLPSFEVSERLGTLPFRFANNPRLPKHNT